jgi:precorrin-2 methylase
MAPFGCPGNGFGAIAGIGIGGIGVGGQPDPVTIKGLDIIRAPVGVTPRRPGIPVMATGGGMIAADIMIAMIAVDMTEDIIAGMRIK